MNEVELTAALSDWNGKATDSLIALHAELCRDGDVMGALVAAMRHPSAQSGATWVIKRHLETGGTADTDQVAQMLVTGVDFQDWSSRLHMLQILPLLVPFDDAALPIVERLVRGGLSDRKPFVRAWAYNGFHLLVGVKPELAGEWQKLKAEAMESERASVKARLRNLP